MRTPNNPIAKDMIMYTRDEAKSESARLRDILNDLGHNIGHSHALEVVARLRGYSDWNTCAAAFDAKADILPIPQGWKAGGDRREYYDIGIDSSLRFKGAHPAVIRYRESSPAEATGFATFMQSFDADSFKGKRLCLSAFLKCEDCNGAVTLWLRADSHSKEAIAFDNLEEKGVAHANGPISGSVHWSQRRIVLDIPEAAERISFEFYVRGKGNGYGAGFSLEDVSQSVPTTVGARSGLDAPVNLALSVSEA